MNDVITTKKCILFPAVVKDLDYFVSLYQDNQSQIGVFRGVPIEALKSLIQDKMEGGYIRIWLAMSKQGKGSRPIGFLYLTDISSYKASVHGFLDKQFLKDLAKELETRYTYSEDCYNGIIDYCFNDLKLERLETIIKRSNTLAYKIDKKVGFKIDGVLRHYLKEDDKYTDIIVMSILKGERLKSTPALADKSDKSLQEVKK